MKYMYFTTTKHIKKWLQFATCIYSGEVLLVS